MTGAESEIAAGNRCSKPLAAFASSQTTLDNRAHHDATERKEVIIRCACEPLQSTQFT